MTLCPAQRVGRTGTSVWKLETEGRNRSPRKSFICWNSTILFFLYIQQFTWNANRPQDDVCQRLSKSNEKSILSDDKLKFGLWWCKANGELLSVVIKNSFKLKIEVYLSIQYIYLGLDLGILVKFLYKTSSSQPWLKSRRLKFGGLWTLDIELCKIWKER